MATDAKGNNHKAAGRPDGGQFDKKAGQGSDDDLDFEAADTRLSAAMPDMDAEDRRRLIDVVIGGPDEDDPVAVAGYLDSLDPGVRFFLSDKARALEARTLDDPDWCDAHAEELMAAVPDIGSGALTDRVDPRLLLVGYYAFRGVGLALLGLTTSKRNPKRKAKVT